MLQKEVAESDRETADPVPLRLPPIGAGASRGGRRGGVTRFVMVESSQVEKKSNGIMNFTKSLSGTKLKSGTLFIGYLNATISSLFIIVSSVGLSSNFFDVNETVFNPIKAYYESVNYIGPPIILTFGIVCFGFTVALIVGTHMEMTQLMRLYVAFGAIGLMLSTGVLSLIVVIMALLGKLTSMIFAMQIFFFFGMYVFELHVIQRTIELFETPSDSQGRIVPYEKDTFLPPYEGCEFEPRLTVGCDS
ncbi:uncharacterized protein LOC113225597 [Hyposmocoma kahamanoa]|uniref:uncharacterized protein LOC113225597 n=1 Tax=Hyposmocoma kahamanoa TaxID=1477025 RepID=UPI000E6DA1C1|nr:uncharacterized protein LOC113225597 [Hyposmocoma kahamanoa]